MNLRKWYAKRKMKQYMLDVWTEDYHAALTAYENDPENKYRTKEWVDVGQQAINEIEALETYKEVRNYFHDYIAGGFNAYEGSFEVIHVLVEN